MPLISLNEITNNVSDMWTRADIHLKYPAIKTGQMGFLRHQRFALDSWKWNEASDEEQDPKRKRHRSEEKTGQIRRENRGETKPVHPPCPFHRVDSIECLTLFYIDNKCGPVNRNVAVWCHKQRAQFDAMTKRQTITLRLLHMPM